MSTTLPASATWTIRSVGTVLVEGASGLGEAGAAIAGSASGAFLVAGATGAMLATPVPISREMGERIGAIERAERAKIAAAGHGGPVAFPTPSPFIDERFVHSLPTQAQIDHRQAEVPRPTAGSAPTRPADEAALESRRYPFVDSHQLAEGVKALGDTGRCFPNFQSFSGDSGSAMRQLTNLMQPPPGWETHHLVEQARTAQFGTQAIQNTANAINLPKAVHTEVSASYSRAPLPGSSAFDYKLSHAEQSITTVRDWVKTLPYEVQRQFSIDSINKAMDKVQTNEQDRSKVEQQIKKLENPDLCPPSASRIADGATIQDVQAGVDRLRPSGVSLPNVQSIQQWNGKPGYGSFVEVADGVVAQHTGRGVYQVVDVQRDLGGSQPPIGQIATMSRDGNIALAQDMAAPALGRS